MTEIKKIIRTYSVDKSCDVCKEGFMRPEGTAFASYPPKYGHRCNKCKAYEVYYKTYPTIEYGE